MVPNALISSASLSFKATRTMPVLSPTDQKQLTQCLWMLEQAMQPARSNPAALTESIRIALAEVPYRSKSSQDDWALTIKLWASECEEFALWPFRRLLIGGRVARGRGTSLAAA
jgi:hypothetical protein